MTPARAYPNVGSGGFAGADEFGADPGPPFPRSAIGMGRISPCKLPGCLAGPRGITMGLVGGFGGVVSDVFGGWGSVVGAGTSNGSRTANAVAYAGFFMPLSAGFAAALAGL